MKHVLLIPALISLCACQAPNERGPVEADTQTSEIRQSGFDSSKAWDEFEGNFRLFYAYIDRDDFDAEAHIARVKSEALKAETPEAFRSTLHRMTYAFTDPHLIVGPFTDDDYNIIPTSSDMIAEVNDGTVTLIDVRAGSAADEGGIRPGWTVQSIGGVPAAKAAIAPIKDLVSQPTAKQKNYAATLAVNGLRKGVRKLSFKETGGTALTLPSPREYALTVSDMPPLSVQRDGNIGIIRINNTLGDNALITEFDTAIASLSDAGGLIIDLRNTPSGGNTEVARSIIGHFVTQTQSYQVHEIPSVEREFTVPRRFIEQVKPRQPYYDARQVVVLGGHWTGSMGEGLVIGLNGAAGIHTIASDMGDLLGGLRNINLDVSGARVDLGSEALFHIDGTPRENYIAETPLVSADLAPDGSDPAIQAAKKYLNGL